MSASSSIIDVLQPVVSLRRLNHKSYWYDPAIERDSAAGTTTVNDPRLIILGTWMNARPQHISKYVAYYAAEYPRTPILLLTSSTADFFLNTPRRQRSDFTPAIEAILSRIDVASKVNSILVHALSNGGSGQVALLSKLYFELHGQPLPARAIILDSCPGKARFRRGLQTFSQGLPKLWLLRFPLQLTFSFLLLIFYVLPRVFGKKNLAELLRIYLNTTDYLPRDARRCYIYSKTDSVILASDIESHAMEAKATGLEVDMVCYQNSGHVQHMKEDPERYWKAVRKAWYQ